MDSSFPAADRIRCGCIRVHAAAILMKLAPLPELKQMFCLDLEEAALDGGSPTQPPQ
jgi:hypothetical protein